MTLAQKYNLYVVEDAAQAIDSYYTGVDGIKKPLGAIGHLAAFSFHETKNIISGEGGMLVINDEKFLERAEIIREKGTNRSKFFRGEVDKYNWVDLGSSFLPSDIIAAFLYGQTENIDTIQNRRREIWQKYYAELKLLENQKHIRLPSVPNYATNNGHMFYFTAKNIQERSMLIDYLKGMGIMVVFHYLSLHKSPFYSKKHDGRNLPNADFYEDCLIRLPLFFELSNEEQDKVIQAIVSFYKGR
jgi:dTDP-4-amino-4,6-dideoxygalactose transaminase